MIEKIEAFEKLHRGQKKLWEQGKKFSPGTRKKTVSLPTKKKMRDKQGGHSTPNRKLQKIKPQKTTLDDLWSGKIKVEGDLGESEYLFGADNC